MTRDELAAAINVLWGGNQSRAARDLGINPRAIRSYLTDPANNSYRTIPAGVARDVKSLLEQFPTGILDIDPRKTISMLQQQMQGMGWTTSEAAGAILGAAVANAVREVGDDMTRELVSKI